MKNKSGLGANFGTSSIGIPPAIPICATSAKIVGISCRFIRAGSPTRQISRQFTDISSTCVFSTSLVSPPREVSRQWVDMSSAFVVVSRSPAAPLQGFQRHLCRVHPKIARTWAPGASTVSQQGLIERLWAKLGRIGAARRDEVFEGTHAVPRPELAVIYDSVFGEGPWKS